MEKRKGKTMNLSYTEFIQFVNGLRANVPTDSSQIYQTALNIANTLFTGTTPLMLAGFSRYEGSQFFTKTAQNLYNDWQIYSGQQSGSPTITTSMNLMQWLKDYWYIPTIAAVLILSKNKKTKL